MLTAAISSAIGFSFKRLINEHLCPVIYADHLQTVARNWQPFIKSTILHISNLSNSPLNFACKSVLSLEGGGIREEC